jgi:uncharacterized membrane protein YeaQ/YmgE (transglycosylase-associated protein family)
MTIQTVIVYLLIGVLAAFLASWLMPKSALSLPGDLVIGVVGSFLGGWIFSLLDVYLGSYLWAYVSAFLGALLFLGIIRLVAPKR